MNHQHRPPAVTTALIRRMLHSAERDEVLADFAIEYSRRVELHGERSARAWAWRQALRSVPGTLRRVWFRGTTGFESEAYRMKGGGLGLESWIMDARFALRSLRSRTQYVLLAVLTLALGIGGTTAIFGIARAILVNPLPYRAVDELVMFWNMYDWSEAEMTYLGNEWRGFSSVAAFTSDGVILRNNDAPAQRVAGVASSAALFDVLGTQPFIGTTFQPGADGVGAEPTAVLSYGFWQELGADRAVIGTTMSMDGVQRRIIGVMPQGFWFPDPSVRVWLSQEMRPDNRSGNYAVVGRLASGFTAASMTEPLNGLTSRLSERFTYSPQFDKTKNAALTPLRDHLLGPVRPALFATLAGMAVILLMACANVATLMLGQLRGRSSELALRMAVGAGKGRLTQQLVVESAMLGLMAGIAGAIAAKGLFKVLLAALPLGELSATVAADWTLFAIALVVAFAAAVLIAMAPVFSLWQGDLRQALSRARSGGIGSGGGRIEDTLVVAEVAMAVLLAAAAAVLIRSVGNLSALNTGVDADGVAVLSVTASSDVSSGQRRQDIFQIVEALNAMPGVASAASIQRLALHERGDNWGVEVEGKPELGPTTTVFRLVTRNYFDALGIKVVRGRTFNETDGPNTEPVVVIDEPFAQKYFPGEDPIGRRVSYGGEGWGRIIGIVNGVAHGGLTDERSPGRYVLYEQVDYVPGGNTFVLKVESGRDASAVLRDATEAIQRVSASTAVHESTTMDAVVATSMGPTRRVMQLMTMLGALALTLGAIGVYGVVSHFVNRRKRDWVIKMALGMKPMSALAQVIRRGAALVALGCAIGLIGALIMTRTLATLLYEVSAADPLALLGAAGTLIVTGCLAAAIPGYRASRANAAQVLRESA